jgi:3-methylcrotonyl-CoA carboxylase alpha subunit
MGVDLVKAQILTAMKEAVFPEHHPLTPRGHSIECRLYAENPFLGGVPSTGKLGHVHFPEGPGRRYEYGFETGDEITPFYDPMIAKVIVWDETRSRAIQKMKKVLQETIIFGVHTNIPYLLEILSHIEFVQGTMTTRFIETHFAEPIKQPALTETEKLFCEQAWKQAGGLLAGGVGVGGSQNATVGGNASGNVNPWLTYWRGI